jgi:hypothetical protein
MAGRTLKNGEVFYFEKKGTSLGYVGVPGCFKQAKKNQTLGGWLPSEYTPVEAPVAAMAISTIAPPGGMTCTRCNQNNPYAAPNKRNSAGDEIYVCYSCR